MGLKTRGDVPLESHETDFNGRSRSACMVPSVRTSVMHGGELTLEPARESSKNDENMPTSNSS